MKNILAALTLLCFCIPAANASENLAPHLELRHGVKQLIVDGRPFLILGGELHNSSSSSSNYMATVWPSLVAKHLNTVLAAVSWELIEPQEGKFDFTTVDDFIAGARQNHLHVVFLWFASWKNGLSSYPPDWVKADPKRFPLAEDQNGHAMNILSTFGKATCEADARAFASLMRHLRKVDGTQHTVLMMQVENEVGVRGDSRDRSAAANAAYNAPVPPALMNYLVQHKATLAPELLKGWAENGNKTAGTWAEVFGPGKPADVQLYGPDLTDEKKEIYWRQLNWASDEFFMAWRYATYVNQVAAAGKAAYDIPMYVNAWQQQPGCPQPGEYPSGGPVPQVNDLWRFAAPNIDFLSPDLYIPQFEWDCERYTRNGNPLFIPEANTGGDSGANALTALLKFNGIGFSPFGIDGWFRPSRGDTNAPSDPLPETYATLDYLAPYILADQGRNLIAFLAPADGTNDPAQVITLGDYKLHINFGSDRQFRNGNARRFSLPPVPPSLFPARLLIGSGTNGFIFVGAGMNATFTSTTPGSQTVRYGSFDEAMLEPDGSWVPGRRLNGDETDHDQRWPFFLRGFSILKVELYRRD